MRTIGATLAVLAAVVGYLAWPGGATAVGAEQCRARVVWNGVQLFGRATIENSSYATVRSGARSGGVERDAVFLHPTGVQKSLAIYPPVTVRLQPGEALFFVGYAGIDDKVPWGDERRPDGARFYVMINGRQVAGTEVAGRSRWEPMVAGPIARAGDRPEEVRVQVTLADDAGPAGNTSYDWALFGEPLLVAVRGNPPQGTALPGVGGIVVFQTDGSEGEIGIEGLDEAGELVAGAKVSVPVAAGEKLAFARFDFSAQEACRSWRWAARGLKATALGGRLGPSARLAYVGTATAVVPEGKPATVRVGVRNEGLGAILPQDKVVVECMGQRQQIERLPAGETAVVSFVARQVKGTTITAKLLVGDPPQQVDERSGEVLRWPRDVKLPGKAPDKAVALGDPYRDGYAILANRQCCWVFDAKAAAARVWVWNGGRWEPAGTAAPWVSFVDSAGRLQRVRFNSVRVEQQDGAAQLRAATVLGGIGLSTTAALKSDSAALEVTVEASARRAPYEVRALWGPEVHAGDLSTGADKAMACFPGLEFLYGDERSSSTRDLAPPLNERWLPHKFKVTVPMMMVETRPGGPTVAVMWDARQKWDGEHMAPAARFASPDFIHHQDNHLMQVGLPSVPDFMPENADMAAEAVAIQPGRPWRLQMAIVATVPRPDATAILRQFDAVVGYPPAEKPPRDFEEEMALCRHGFMVTLWDEETKKHRHCVGWGPANAPGFAALMLVDGRAVARGADKRAVLERVDLIGRQTIAQEGEAGLASRANCHIMTWEFPYHWGHLPGALAGMRAQAYAAFNSQEADGGWGYYPDERRKVLGEAGTRVIGIAARNAYVMAKWVAISGDPVIEAALRKAIAHMERYRVPRGAQGWECPILEPDVLAAAYAVRAYVWAYMALGDPALLDKARYWARTGLPFQYAWDDGEHPGMRYASIPVFGSTFFRHSWIGLPVQWCGLVYAYGLQELMRFVPDDLYRRQVEGITVSAMYQQWPMDERPELAGSYPDSFGQWFTRRNPAYLSPENIAVNLLALRGLDPGLRSVRVKLAGGVAHLTAPADIKSLRVEGEAVTAELKYIAPEVFYVSLGPVDVGAGAKVVAGGQRLARRQDLGAGEVGWTVAEETRTLVVGLRAGEGGTVELSISGVRYARPPAPEIRTGWDFEKGTQQWRPGHSCTVRHGRGTLVIRSTGEDPYALSGPASIDAERFKKLAVRLRLTAGEAVALFWRTNKSPGFSADKSLAVKVAADGRWHEVVFDLSRHSGWSGKVLQIRLDPEPAEVPPGTVLEVDWIRPQ